MGNFPEELLKISGIGEKRLKTITESYSEQQETREVMLFLQQFGVGPGIAVRVYKNYKDKSVQVLRENPYRLADEVYGIGFITADRIARKMGIERDSLDRLCAGLKYTMYRAVDEGHVFLPVEELLQRGSELLSVEKELLIQAFLALEEKQDIVIERSWGREDVYLAAFHHSEKAVARRLFLLSEMMDKPLDISDEIIINTKHCGIKMAKRQREALEMRLYMGAVITRGQGQVKPQQFRVWWNF